MGCTYSRFNDPIYKHSQPIDQIKDNSGESQIYRHPLHLKDPSYSLKIDSSITNVHDIYIRAFKNFQNNKFLATRERKRDGTLGTYTFKTYGQIHEQATKLGSGFRNLRLEEKAKVQDQFQRRGHPGQFSSPTRPDQQMTGNPLSPDQLVQPNRLSSSYQNSPATIPNQIYQSTTHGNNLNNLDYAQNYGNPLNNPNTYNQSIAMSNPNINPATSGIYNQPSPYGIQNPLNMSSPIGPNQVNIGLRNPLAGSHNRALRHPVQYDPLDDNTNFMIIWSKSREEWVVSDIACTLYGFCTVPMYDTQGPDVLSIILDQTRATTVLTSQEHIDVVISLSESHPTLLNIVTFDQYTTNQKQRANQSGLKIFTYDEVMKAGEKKISYIRPSSSDFYSINYTTNTVNQQPKGIVLTHENQVATATGLANRVDMKFGPRDSYLSHIDPACPFERTVLLFCAINGGYIGFYNGDSTRLTEDLWAFKPTMFSALPRFYNRFYDKMLEGVNQVRWRLTKSFRSGAVSSKYSTWKARGRHWSIFYDPIVFSKMKKSLGGKVKIMLCGTGPIEQDKADFVRAAIGASFLDCYGLTETGGISFTTRADKYAIGHAGGPLSNVEFKVVDVPEMKFKSMDLNEQGLLEPRGEIYLKGRGIFKKYYRDPYMTQEAFTDDGWFKTGDIGKINRDGSLSVIGRKSSMYKLLNLDVWINPEKIENVYLNSPFISEIFVYGDQYRGHNIAIIVPRKEVVEQLAEMYKLKGRPYAELLETKLIKDKIMEHLYLKGREYELETYELPALIHLEQTSFKNNHLLTPTMKTNRLAARQFYLTLIEQMYLIPIKPKGM